MSKRTHYRNGDEISLSCGCDGCSPSMINGVLCHEQGCPEEWRDYQVQCWACGCDFYPKARYQLYCGCGWDDPDESYCEHCECYHEGECDE